MKLQQTGKILQKFLNALQKQLCNHHNQQSKHMLWELEQLKPASYEKITASMQSAWTPHIFAESLGLRTCSGTRISDEFA